MKIIMIFYIVIESSAKTLEQFMDIVCKPRRKHKSKSTLKLQNTCRTVAFAPGQVAFGDKSFEDKFHGSCQKSNIFSFNSRLSLPALQSLGRCNSFPNGPKMEVGRHKQGNIVHELDERRTKFWTGRRGMFTPRLDVQLAMEWRPVWRHKILFYLWICTRVRQDEVHYHLDKGKETSKTYSTKKCLHIILVFHDQHFYQMWQVWKWISVPLICQIFP